MKYSAGLVSKPFWYMESKKTASYMLEGLDKASIKQLIMSENIYQAPTEYRSNQILNTVYNILSTLDGALLEHIMLSVVSTSKVVAYLESVMGEQ
jgi:hypothetical protein